VVDVNWRRCSFCFAGTNNPGPPGWSVASDGQAAICDNCIYKLPLVQNYRRDFKAIGEILDRDETEGLCYEGEEEIGESEGDVEAVLGGYEQEMARWSLRELLRILNLLTNEKALRLMTETRMLLVQRRVDRALEALSILASPSCAGATVGVRRSLDALMPWISHAQTIAPRVIWQASEAKVALMAYLKSTETE
jgi:hypothetical protein